MNKIDERMIFVVNIIIPIFALISGLFKPFIKEKYASDIAE